VLETTLCDPKKFALTHGALDYLGQAVDQERFLNSCSVVSFNCDGTLWAAVQPGLLLSSCTVHEASSDATKVVLEEAKDHCASAASLLVSNIDVVLAEPARCQVSHALHPTRLLIAGCFCLHAAVRLPAMSTIASCAYLEVARRTPQQLAPGLHCNLQAGSSSAAQPPRAQPLARKRHSIPKPSATLTAWLQRAEQEAGAAGATERKAVSRPPLKRFDPQNLAGAERLGILQAGSAHDVQHAAGGQTSTKSSSDIHG
jgi:hypothetical protein